jgi:Bacterial antitoxin of type II TA system, VapB
MRMKRTNLVLDPELLDQARRLLGVKTYSAAVNLALAEVLRVRKIQSLPLFFGKGLWQGNLGEMRDDAAERPRQKKRQSRGRR